MHVGWIIHLWLFTLSLKAEAIPLLTNGSRKGGLNSNLLWITPGPNTLHEQIFVDYTCTGSSSQRQEHKCQCSDSYRTLLSALICYPQATVSWWKWLILPVQCPSYVPSDCLDFTKGVRKRGKSVKNKDADFVVSHFLITIGILQIRIACIGSMGMDIKVKEKGKWMYRWHVKRGTAHH